MGFGFYDSLRVAVLLALSSPNSFPISPLSLSDSQQRGTETNPSLSSSILSSFERIPGSSSFNPQIGLLLSNPLTAVDSIRCPLVRFGSIRFNLGFSCWVLIQIYFTSLVLRFLVGYSNSSFGYLFCVLSLVRFFFSHAFPLFPISSRFLCS